MEETPPPRRLQDMFEYRTDLSQIVGLLEEVGGLTLEDIQDELLISKDRIRSALSLLEENGHVHVDMWMLFSRPLHIYTSNRTYSE